jgi:hypothetical protein
MTTPDFNVPIYASVVSRESVKILLTLASLNNLKILAADISNAYLNADCAENVCFKAGKEFGEREGQWAVVKRSLYGLKSAGASFGANLARCLEEDLKFKRCKGDRDVWMRKATKISDGSEYWEYVCTYVDDILAISERPEEIMERSASKHQANTKHTWTTLMSRSLLCKIEMSRNVFFSLSKCTSNNFLIFCV